MSKFSLALLGLSLLATTGCDVLGPSMTGTWDVEIVDADDCKVELELEEKGGEISGEAEVECTLYLVIDGEYYSYELEDDADVSGETDGVEFELEFEVYDPIWETDVEIVLTGEIDGDDLDGEAEVDGDDWGDIEGDR